MPEGVPTENVILFGVVEIAELWSAGWHNSNRVCSTRANNTTQFWRADGCHSFFFISRAYLN
jgi:hypothetical protein